MDAFADRHDAGRLLGARLRSMPADALPRADLVVVGLPRGGVPVASEVARALGAPLDVMIVRKLGVPNQPELAMGAIGEDGVRVLNEEVLSLARVSDEELRATEARESIELERRSARFRGSRPRISLLGRVVLVVDDGIATGSTVRAACRVARAQGARSVIVAAPVAPPDTVRALATDADDVIALFSPSRFVAIGQFYDDFAQTTDDEVVRLLDADPG